MSMNEHVVLVKPVPDNPFVVGHRMKEAPMGKLAGKRQLEVRTRRPKA